MTKTERRRVLEPEGIDHLVVVHLDEWNNRRASEKALKHVDHTEVPLNADLRHELLGSDGAKPKINVADKTRELCVIDTKARFGRVERVVCGVALFTGAECPPCIPLVEVSHALAHLGVFTSVAQLNLLKLLVVDPNLFCKQVRLFVAQM